MRSRLVASTILWAIVLAIFAQFSVSPVALAATIEGGEGWGRTTCWNEPTGDKCMATADLDMDRYLDVENGDTVYYEYHIWWVDHRPASSPQATHEYQLRVSVPGSPAQIKGTLVYTTGGYVIGSDTLTIYVNNVRVGWDVTVEIYAGVTIPSACFAYDTDWGIQTYY